MRARTAAFVLAALAVGGLVAAPRAQTTPSLAGTWRFNEVETEEDQSNWRRPIDPPPSVPADSQPGGRPGIPVIVPVTPPPTYVLGRPRLWQTPHVNRVPEPVSTLKEPWRTDVRRALRDLLEVAERYTITIEPGRVTFTDDLDHRTTYATNGKSEKHHAGATDFDVKTTWKGAQLGQQISAVDIFKMSRTFVPGDDGRAFFVSITVEKPELEPPVRKLVRVYSRASSGGAPR
jgi:hypothetical protein